ncbi:MAG: DUF503 domain-containing protein [Nitrospirae bacterium]|nr:DUF503 domain-containing protein [Nitrospirota bacterium]
MPRRIEREENKLVVGVLSLELFLDGRQSLKEKRYALRKILDRVRNEFNVSIAETGFQDLWQRSGLGITMVSSDRRIVDSILDRIPRLIETWTDAQVTRADREVFYFG